MAVGPLLLLSPNRSDLAKIEELEIFIDTSQEFQNYLGGKVIVKIRPDLFEQFTNDPRSRIRKHELIRRYVKTGWYYVTFLENAIEFSDRAPVDVSAGRD